MQIITDKATPELFDALAKAQAVIENATRASVNPHYKTRYADLAEVLNRIRPAFSQFGLSLVQSPPHFSEGRVYVTTLIGHSSGGFIAGTASCETPRSDGQGVGSSCTYLRRQGAAAMCGISQEDDDGESVKIVGPGLDEMLRQIAEAPDRDAWVRARTLAAQKHPESADAIRAVALKRRDQLIAADGGK